MSKGQTAVFTATEVSTRLEEYDAPVGHRRRLPVGTAVLVPQGQEDDEPRCNIEIRLKDLANLGPFVVGQAYRVSVEPHPGPEA